MQMSVMQANFDFVLYGDDMVETHIKLCLHILQISRKDPALLDVEYEKSEFTADVITKIFFFFGGGCGLFFSQWLFLFFKVVSFSITRLVNFY